MTSSPVLFLDLLRVSLGTQEALSAVPSGEQWQEIYALAEKHTLVSFVTQGISRLPQEQLPDMVLLMDWLGQGENNKIQHKIQCEQWASVAAHLAEEQLPYCLLKGLGVAQYYPEPGLRACGDFDIWIPATRERVRAFAEKYGQRGHEIYHHVDAGQIDGAEVELHFTPSWMNNICVNNRFQRWLRESFDTHCEEVLIGENKVRVPDVAFNLVYVLNHIYRHIFNEGVGLRQIIDYYYVLRTISDERFVINDEAGAVRDEAVRLIREFHMMKFAGALMWVLHEVLGMPAEQLLVAPDEARGRALIREVLLAGNFGHYDSRNTYSMHDPLLRRIASRMKHDFRFFTQYPEETLWSPIWKAKEVVRRHSASRG